MNEYLNDYINHKRRYFKFEQKIFTSPRWKLYTTIWLIFATVFFLWNITLIYNGLDAKSKTNNEATSNVGDSAEDTSTLTAENVYTVFLDIKCRENIFFNKDDITVYLDGEKIGVVQHGWELTMFRNLSSGNHIIRFESSSSCEKQFNINEAGTLTCNITVDSSELDINEFNYSNTINANTKIVESIPGIYYGFGPSTLVLKDDFTAEYCENSYDEVSRGGSWYYKDGQLNIKLIRPACKIYTPLNKEINNEKFSLITDNPWTWKNEDFIKISNKSASLSLDECKAVINDGKEQAKLLDLIEKINMLGEIDKNSGAAIETARKLYLELDDKHKIMVENISVLDEAETKYNHIQKIEVEKAINNIGEVTLNTEPLINEARNLYNAQSDDVKNAISNYDVLIQAEEMISNLKVQNVRNILSEIEVETITLDDYDKIKNALNEYNNLTAAEKNLVDNSIVLKEALDKVNELSEANKKAEAAKAEANRSESIAETEVYGNLTIDNCPELRAILSNKASFDESYVEFANKYKDRIIEFDGRIDYCTTHGNYKTRFDYLVSAGDYDPDRQIGPTFKFDNVNYANLHTNIPTVSVGLNVHIVAKVESYNSTSELFFLEPVSVTSR